MTEHVSFTPLRQPLARIPRDIAAASDYESLAAEFLAPATAAWLAGGSGEEQTLRGNRAAFARLALRNRLWDFPRMIDTGLSLLGQRFVHPLLLAPVASQRLVHPLAEVATAQGAQAMDAGMVLSLLSSCSLEEVGLSVSRRWLQLYWQASVERTLALAHAAQQAGCQVLVLTLDTPVQSLSRGAQRAGFALPTGLRAPILAALPPLPHEHAAQGTLGILLQRAATISELRAFVAASPLPVLVKGVLHGEDARMLLDSGVQGLVVSNHGGRALDGALPSLTALPALRQAVGPQYPLLLDSGIRSGHDVFKALALGADAVLIGRLQAYALAVAGPLGVAHMLRLLLEELQLCMALTGCASLADIGPHCVISQEF